MVKVRKTFSFHAAHKIDHHQGECRNLHGHTYTVIIEARGPIQPDDGRPEGGMVIDFGRMKQLYNELIHSVCDHAYLNDTPFGKGQATTAENLASAFLAVLHTREPLIYAVEVSEGPGNTARSEWS